MASTRARTVSEPTARQRLQQPRLLAIGEALIDLISTNNEPLQTTSALEVQIGGAPLNVAVAYSRLGGSAMFCGKLSTDAFGERIASLIEAEGIDRVPPSFTDAQTRLAVVDHSQPGAAFRFYGSDPADSTLSAEDTNNAFESPIHAMYCGSLLLAHADSAAAQRHAIKEAQARAIPIIADPNPRAILWKSKDLMRRACLELVEAASVAKLSRDDLRLLGIVDDPAHAIDLLSGPDRLVIVTDGGHGCWANIGRNVVHIPSPPDIDVIDPTGAGDAFMGAIALRYTRQGTLTEEDLTFASHVGAAATTKRGAIASLPRLSDLERNSADYRRD